MALPSKEEQVKEQFFNQPTKHWHFKEIKKEVNIADSKLSKWLKRLQGQNIIKRIKEKGKMPYYIAEHETPEYKNSKKLFAMKKLHESGLLNYLLSIKADTVIIFGSFSRSDWHSRSDIDIFIKGKPKIEIGKYEKKLQRDIQIFAAQDEKELKKMGSALLKNIIRGDILKGEAEKVIKHAKV